LAVDKPKAPHINQQTTCIVIVCDLCTQHICSCQNTGIERILLYLTIGRKVEKYFDMLNLALCLEL